MQWLRHWLGIERDRWFEIPFEELPPLPAIVSLLLGISLVTSVACLWSNLCHRERERERERDGFRKIARLKERPPDRGTEREKDEKERE